MTALPSTSDVHQVRELRTSHPRARVIDVRTPGEFESAHIPGSRNVPLDLLQRHRGALATEHTDPVVLVCRTGNRAEQARTLLAESGFDELTVLGGGVDAWDRSDAPLERGRGKWAMERQVRLVAGSVVLTSVLGSRFVPKLKWVAAFIGGGLTFAAITDTCGMAKALSLLPYNRTPQHDADDLLSALTGADPAR
ncbi:rhodanese-like domain-containing protein [Saccharopolyspora sp. HNM0983]|uniref:Rhodanese-like domain-containing protein n=1 Tax=Saccharopolyspora montiporae TaxID=2781240 RepID=A0A929B9C6_9PSEU|nr:rhodanese-like domain-containing protein [Saccharopolyspora sp. HNM0983]MBE9374230.1 rhodanese-like domain-containing protein [Saccharopolyspora sp. HNM0983]